jgi:hypothetical protein
MKTRIRNKILKQLGTKFGFEKDHLNEEIPSRKLNRKELIRRCMIYIQSEMDYYYSRHCGY